MTKLILYYLIRSPSSRAVKYVTELLGLDVEIRDVEILKNEQKTEEYLKLNPAQTVPTLVDGDVVISDSHAIMMYLVDKFAPNNDLYPVELIQRSRIHSMLFFETQFLFGRVRIAIEPIYYDGKSETYDYLLSKIPESLSRFERILSKQRSFVTGDTITIADFSCITTIAGIDSFVPFDVETYPAITAWKSRMFEKFPNIKETEEKVVVDFKKMMEEMKTAAKQRE